MCIDSKTKHKLKEIAYSQKLTISNYIRELINFAIACNELDTIDSKKNSANNQIKQFMALLGGNKHA